MDSADLVTGGKIAGAIGAAGGVVSATAVGVFKFFSRFQTKNDCITAHAKHDELDKERQNTRDEKLGRIHDAVERTEILVNKMAGDFYGPRLENSRRGDSE